jgi:hypothetical protein
MYQFRTANNDGFIALDANGIVHHLTTSGVTTLLADTPILDLSAVTPVIDDFFILNFDDRAYISPTNQLEDAHQPLYVYLGDGTQARPAGGTHPVAADGNLTATPGGPGNVEMGIHIFNAVYETDTGFLTAPGEVFAQATFDGTTNVILSNIPVSPNPYVKFVWLTATKAIDPTLFTGNVRDYEPFFIPGARIPNGTTTYTANFFDSELLTSADNLFDLKDIIPAGTGMLGMYHGRMLSVGAQTPPGTTPDNTGGPDIVWVSNPGEPEAFNSVSGFVTLPRDGLGITQAFEYRDIMYVGKLNILYAFGDNGGDPVDWPLSVIEGGLGVTVHGLAMTRQNESLDIEYVLLMNQSGVFNFQGLFMRPMGELTYKIQDYFNGSTQGTGLPAWTQLDEFNLDENYQIMNDVYNQLILISIPDRTQILVGDYKMGMDPKSIRWTKWDLPEGVFPTTIAMHALKNTLFIGSANAGISFLQFNSGKTNDTVYTSVPLGTVTTTAIPMPYLRTAFVGD